MEPIIVVGAGLAGYGVLRELRKLDGEAPLTLVAADSGDFYSKPMLSTALAKGKSAAQLVGSSAEKMAEQHGFALHPRTRVERIDPRSCTLHTDAGELRYSSLILALGGQPVRLALQGDAADAVLSINDLDDYQQFRQQLEGKLHVGIIGAGLIGCEFANDLSASGYQVSVVDPLPTPLGALLPTQAARPLQRALTEQGVQWHLGAAASAVWAHADGYELELQDGRRILVDLVISAVGLRPRSELAARAGLAVGRGIRVNAYGQTSDPHIYAVGDCAEYPQGVCLYITPIMAAARAIAASILQQPTPMRFPPLSVIVKTSAYPLALLPPTPDSSGEWLAVEQDNQGMKLLFRDPAGHLTGYVLAGSHSTLRAEMDRQVGLPLAP
ncbi:FAD-dependent oxidoreductase [Pseudomonas sp. NBRC 100443]|uniref:NAD(P)/FAD-dependent oxidoreductase n=1 Tax=Pseudomonas sp. NBRC 100443 TaxID=1113665 RepID=UPI0024A08A39|nr:FAD-dependent oxidoreductase [Pseudomonas sp. NBRC 100443]GLU37358.1 Rubredoxin-NAD(+) reductase [Pseudomonas sp. NBRC 100443]